MRMGKKNMERKYNTEYINYVRHGESAAVFITRDIAKEIPTDGMWIAVVDGENKRRKDGRWDFKYFIIELFPRIINPDYSKCISEEDKKYTTWETAHIDIEKQRSKGYHGVKYKVIPCLVNRNKDRFIVKKAAWNNRFNQWVPDRCFGSSCEWRERKIPVDPKWEYEIVSVKKL